MIFSITIQTKVQHENVLFLQYRSSNELQNCVLLQVIMMALSSDSGGTSQEIQPQTKVSFSQAPVLLLYES